MELIGITEYSDCLIERWEKRTKVYTNPLRPTGDIVIETIFRITGKWSSKVEIDLTSPLKPLRVVRTTGEIKAIKIKY
jgi:hypothetical protein